MRMADECVQLMRDVASDRVLSLQNCKSRAKEGYRELKGTMGYEQTQEIALNSSFNEDERLI